MFGPSTYSSFQSFYPSPSSFGQPQTLQVAGHGAADVTPFQTASDVFYGAAAGDGGPQAATGPQRLGYPGYDALQPAADADFQPPYFPPPNPAPGSGLFVHHRQVPVTHQQQSLRQPVVDQSMYWSPINNTAVYTTSANVDQHKTYHSLQQVSLYNSAIQLLF